MAKTGLKVLTIAAAGLLALAGCAAPEGEVMVASGSMPPPTIDIPYEDMAREVSDGSVQVFPLGGTVPDVPLYAEGGMSDGGVAIKNNPSVVVYPLNPVPAAASFATAGPGYIPGMPPLVAGAPAFPTPFPGGAESIRRIFYPHGSSSLGIDDKEIIKEVVRTYAANPESAVLVEGHASERAEANDPTQKRIINLKTSVDRAYKVSRELIKEGVPATAIETRAYGDTRPGLTMPGVDAEEASRRVEIYTAPSSPSYLSQ